MAQPTNTFDTYDDSTSRREDLSDIITNISPTDRPFMTAIGKGKASNTLHEWLTDVIAAALDDNAQIEADDATGDSITAAVRLTNRSQISDKVVVISGSEEAADKAGKTSELRYQLAKAGKALARDMEKILTVGQTDIPGVGNGPQPSKVGTSSVAQLLASAAGWIKTNSDRGNGGADSTYTTMPDDASNHNDSMDGTQRAFTESMLAGMLQAAWTEGGEPSMVIVGAFNKRVASGFTGQSTRMDKGEDKKLTAAIDYYVGDFGEVRIVPDRFGRARDALIIDPNLWSVDYYRSFRTHPLAKTGDSEKRQMIVEYTLCSKQEAGNAIIADLTTS